MNKRHAMAILLVLGLFGCATTGWTNIMDSWKGHGLNELVQSWGAPDSVQQLSDGTKVATYSQSVIIAATQYNCRAWFTADSKERIFASKHEGACGAFFSHKTGPSSNQR